ncbi:hypothetical protein WI666_01675 [Vibrio cholerae]
MLTLARDVLVALSGDVRRAGMIGPMLGLANIRDCSAHHRRHARSDLSARS